MRVPCRVPLRASPQDTHADAGGSDEDDDDGGGGQPTRVAARKHLNGSAADGEGPYPKPVAEPERRRPEKLPEVSWLPHLEPDEVVETSIRLRSGLMARRTPVQDELNCLLGVLKSLAPDEVPVRERGSPSPSMEGRLHHDVRRRHGGGRGRGAWEGDCLGARPGTWRRWEGVGLGGGEAWWRGGGRETAVERGGGWRLRRSKAGELGLEGGTRGRRLDGERTEEGRVTKRWREREEPAGEWYLYGKS